MPSPKVFARLKSAAWLRLGGKRICWNSYSRSEQIRKVRVPALRRGRPSPEARTGFILNFNETVDEINAEGRWIGHIFAEAISDAPLNRKDCWRDTNKTIGAGLKHLHQCKNLL